MPKLLRHFALAAALAAVLVVFPFAAARPAPAQGAAPPAATFNQNLLLQGSSSAGEPSIRTDRFGQSFVIGPIGVPAGCKAFRVRHDGSASTFLGFPDSTAGGGDCDWALGPQETSPAISPAPSDNVLAFSSLTLANITVGKSDNGGSSFGPPNALSTQVSPDDRMWQAADPKLNGAGYDDMFMTYHDLNTDDIQLSLSLDGGQTYTQNGPIVNFMDVPPGQVLASCPAALCIAGPFSAGTGNELGNIVARRDALGQLTLYSIFTTPDSQADNVGGAGGENRVYEAVGTVTDSPAGTPQTINWRNYEIWHGPVGARYDRIFPVTAVDNAGHVYAIFTDGKNTLFKSDANGTGWNPATPPTVIPNPVGVNTTVFPWAAAGANGIVDVVFYGANGGAAGDNTDPNALWNVYMAQTIDGGSSWTLSQASDHQIHKGIICTGGTTCSTSDRVLLDFFQVSIDPTNGAADIAYTDDHASPGNPVLYFTRQCTGASATTGLALTNDCMVPPPPPPPPPGNPCPGPQIEDFTNDAPNSVPAGDGSNVDGLDIENVTYSSGGAGMLKITLTAKNLALPPPPANMTGSFWSVYFTIGTTQYIVQASGTGNAATVMYTAGPDDGNQADDEFNNPSLASMGGSGSFNPGPNGTIVFTVPLSEVGNPLPGTQLTNLFADTHGAVIPPAAAGGVYWTAALDRAPDSNYSRDSSGSLITYTIGDMCSGGGGGGGTPAHLALAPKTETDTVGTQASETATVTDSSNNPVQGVVVRFSVTGANQGTFTPTTDQFGQAKITYTGTNTGTDNISAYADTNNNTTQDTGEPGDTATKTWNPPVTTPCTVKITNGGWITADDGNKSNFGGNAQAATNGSLSGQEQFRDQGANVDMHSINVTTVTCPSPTQAQIFGTATINGSGTFNYTITVQDGASTNQPDMYGIKVGSYSSGEHSLGGGQIDIHKN
jgi:hypothetical protein